MKYEIEEVSIASIKAGDTIEHEGVLRTVCHYDIRDLAVKTDAPNCYDRVFHFYDGSKISKTRDGFVAE